ncbi:MAG: glycoside hydrolase family 76 protein [Solirubrobacteraceae bacterium]
MSARAGTRSLRGTIRALLAACALAVLLQVPAGAQPALAASSRSAPAPRVAGYPATATRPAFRVSAGKLRQLLRTRAATSRKKINKKKKKPKEPQLTGDAARAMLAFEAMQANYYIAGSGLYKGEPFSYLWPFSQALAATVTLANVPGVKAAPALKSLAARELKARVIGLRTYLDPNNAGAPEGIYTSTLPAFDGTVTPPVGPGGAKYYDDNEWIGIELVRMYRLTREPALLSTAESIMAFEMGGFSQDPSLGCPGGIPFSNLASEGNRNTITTAPAAELAAQLYRVTRNAAYLQFAQTAYAWVRRCLLESNNMYGDHVGRRGVIEPYLWSYTQGVMIGAGTLLYQATGNGEFLYQARQTAKAALAYFTPAQLGAEIPFFPSIYFRNVLYLDSVTHDPPGAKLVQPYVDYAWLHLRLANNLFVSGSPPSGQLLVQAAIVQDYALLASPPVSYF